MNFEIRNKTRLEFWVEFLPALLLCAIWFVVMSYLLTLQVFVPDENHFMWLARAKLLLSHSDGSSAPISVFKINNLEGFGGLYWWGMAALQAYTKDPRLNLRICTLIFASAIPIAYLVSGIKRAAPFATFCVLAIWFVQPAAWWMGKISSVETFCLSLNALAVALLISSEKRSSCLLAFFLFGIAAASKIIAVSGFIAGIVFLVLNPKRTENLKSAIFISIFFLVGFVFGHPNILVKPAAYVQALSALSAPTSNWPLSIDRVLFGQFYQWDVVFDGGLFAWSLPLVVYGGLFLLAIAIPKKGDRSVASSVLITFLIMFTILSRNARYYGWYWFPLLPLFPIVIFHLRLDAWKLKAAVLSAVLVALVINFPTIYSEVESKIQHSSNLNALPEIGRCIELRIKDYSYDAVVEAIEIGNDESNEIWTSKQLRSHVGDSAKILTSSKWSPTEDNLFPNDSDFFDGSKKFVFLLGTRMLKVHSDLASANGLSKGLAATSKLMEIWDVKEIDHCGFVRIFVAEKRG